MYIGIDVGGTNLKAGLVDEAGTILATERVPLDFQGPEAFAKTLAELAGKLLRDGVKWVGMGLPGGIMGVRGLEGSYSGSKTCRGSSRTAGQNSLSSETKGKAPGAGALGFGGSHLP